jgi:hypothetical protein
MSKLSLTSAQVLAILGVWGVKSHKQSVAILAVRDADGDGNEAGVFDDRFYVAGSDGSVTSFQGNTDPTNPWVKRRATMETGQIVTYQAGKHKLAFDFPRGYPAFRQVSRASFRRTDVGREFTNIAANIHHGSRSGTTSSEACQTVPFSLWDEFKPKVYKYLGVTDSDVKKSPLGTGPIFEYLILSRADVDAALQKSKKVVIEAVKPTEAAPTFTYVLPSGAHIEGVRMVVGVGYAPTRRALAAMLGEANPEKLFFQFAPDGDDDDSHPDLTFKDVGGDIHPIHVLDASAGSTMGRITDLARAAGLTWSVDQEKKIVTFTRFLESKP